MALYLLIDRDPYESFGGLHQVFGGGRDLPPSGIGFLSGSYPDGITRIEGVPSSCQVRVLYRAGSLQPGDGVVVAEVISGADGTWRVDGLSPSLRYDVVCRHDGYADMIISDVTPEIV